VSVLNLKLGQKPFTTVSVSGILTSIFTGVLATDFAKINGFFLCHTMG
jgi:hypothetical protein